MLHLHPECGTAFLHQLTSEHLVYRRPKKKPQGRWVWAPKTEGRANHLFDVLVGIYVIADIKSLRLLASRHVVEAKLSQVRAAGGGRCEAGGRRRADAGQAGVLRDEAEITDRRSAAGNAATIDLQGTFIARPLHGRVMPQPLRQEFR